MNKGLVKVGGNLGGVRKRTKGHSVRPNLKPHGPRWPAQRPLHRAAPHIRACLHSAGLLQSLTAGKTSLFLWARSQEKATSACFLQRRRYSDRPSPTAAQSKNKLAEEKLNGDEAERETARWEKVVFHTQRSSVRHAKRLSKRRSRSQIVRWSMCPCVANLRSSTAVFSRYVSGYKSPGSTVGANTCRRICSGRGGIRTRESGEGIASHRDWHKREHKTNTDRNKKKEVLQSLVYIPQPEVSSDPETIQSSPD